MRHSSGKKIEKRAWGTFLTSGRVKAGTTSASLREKAHLQLSFFINSQKALLLQFLAGDAMPGPGDRLEAFLVDRLAAFDAASVFALFVAT